MISLYGSLARAFEKKYKTPARDIQIYVNSVAEMMKAMEANFNGFRAMIKRKGYYHVSRGDDLEDSRTVDSREVEMNFGEKSFHIMPVVAGCGGKNGVVQTIAGVVLIVVGAVMTYLAPALGVYGMPMMKMGAAMAIGGVAQMLTPSPATDYGAAEKTDERKSYLFNGPTNAVEPGTTIPVVYGESFVGSTIVSGGVVVEDE